MPSPYKIRQVDGTDKSVEASIREMHRICFGKQAKHVSTAIGSWWLVHRGDEAIGFAGLYPSSQYYDAGYMVRAGVLPAHRGHGLQRRLLRVREAKAKRKGWTCVVTDCTDTVYSANNLIAAGYKIFDPACRWAFEKSIYLWKEF